MKRQTDGKSRKARNPIPLSVDAPRSVLRAGHATSLLIVLFLAALGYLTYTLLTEASYYVAMSGTADYGIVYDRTGDVLFDGSRPLEEYPAGQFADVGNFIGDTSGQMTNTLVSRNLADLTNYSFMLGASEGNASLETTLLHSANRAVFEAMGEKEGTVIACNWKTGELLVCVSKPCVDIAEGYADLANMPSGSLLCKAFYPMVPGSTQKVSTLIAAYETCGVEQINAMEYGCSGSWLNAKRQRINCHKEQGHGAQTLIQAFANSCNPYFAQLVQSEQLPLSGVIETFTQMGYSVNGEKANSLSMDGITASPATITLADPKDFDTQWSCLGQGDTLISPYQLMIWQTAIAAGNGKAVQPYVISAKTNAEGDRTEHTVQRTAEQLFSAQTAQAVRDVMTQNAAAYYSDTLGSYVCGVKSGTAQIIDHGEEYENSLLVGFSMQDTCPVAFCILIEKRNAGELTTASLAKVLLDALQGMI